MEASIFRRLKGVFFASGAAALLYELTFLHRVQLLVGHTLSALALTVALYLAGLGLGALSFEKLLRFRKFSALQLYLGLEIFIGVYALCFPLLEKIAARFVDGALHITGDSNLAITLIQLLAASCLILPPTIAMGTTLPLLVEATHPRETTSLYRVNTWGAAFGVMIGGYLLLPILGVSETLWIAAAINLSLPVWIGKDLRGSTHQPAPIGSALNDRSMPATNTLLLAFISGALGMILQVLWNRLAALGFGPHPYIFPAVTGGVLVGLALGASLRANPHVRGSFSALAFTVVLLGSLTWAIEGWNQTPHLVGWLHGLVDRKNTLPPSIYYGVTLLLTWIWILPVTIFSGMIFPRALEQARSSHQVGRILLFNLLGLLIGGIFASHALLPTVGLQGLTLIALTFCLGLLWLWDHQLSKPLRLLGTLAAALLALQLPLPDHARLTRGNFYNRGSPLSSTELLEAGYTSQAEFEDAHSIPILATRDDPHATISIHENDSRAHRRFFRVNGKVDGNNDTDMKTTRVVAWLPLLYPQAFQHGASRALVIGLGTGSTASETLRFPGLVQTDVAELSPAMVDFSKRFFPEQSQNLHTDPRVTIRNRDGREFLEHTQTQYDVIISEPSNPWVNGVASLFTTEYYAAVAKRLKPTGVAALWFHTYGLDCPAVHSVFASVAKIFPQVDVFAVGGDLFLMARKQAIPLEPMDARPASNLAAIRSDLFAYGKIETGLTLQSQYKQFLEKTWVADREAITDLVGLREPNSDDNSTLQYQSAKTFWTKVSCPTLTVRSFGPRVRTRIDEVLAQVGADSPSEPAPTMSRTLSSK